MRIAYFQLYDRFLMITEEWSIYNRLGNLLSSHLRARALLRCDAIIFQCYSLTLCCVDNIAEFN